MSPPESAAAPAAWRLAPLVDLHWRRWGDEWLVFDAGSGKTHKIDTLTALSLIVLEGGPASPAALAATIARELALDEGADSALPLTDVLANLHQIGLVTFPAG